MYMLKFKIKISDMQAQIGQPSYRAKLDGPVKM